MRLEELGGQIRPLLKGNSLAVVTDENVAKLYLNRCIQSLKSEGFDVYKFVIPPGEGSKDGKTYLELMNFLAEIPLTRADALIALGGGVVGDLTGFAAATYLRGISVIQVPTTLLAAVDSSVGGKTAINLSAGKNLAGAFHQPALIWCDATLLASLPDNIYQDGMAEVIKYGVIADAQLFELLCDREKAESCIEEIIRRCVRIKKRFVEEDEYDTGVRQLLNFGHTIGHAIEKASDFRVSHGSAVAKGMAMMADIAVRQGWCDEETKVRIIDLLKLYEFDLTVAQTKAELYDIMKADKKRKGQFIDIVVPERIGVCRLQRLTTEELEDIL
ncbi:3-dehydroquinate synthase [Ihubacter sp. rT4E-8]|uniref:3-dehydroquinate synthase n=1 Tax=Ihubacter sp. rT4E-8 TaxID=3242369 RepID=UPI003CE7169E